MAERRDPSQIRPGWYWYYKGPELVTAYSEFAARHRDVFKPRKTFKDDTGSGAEIVVFEVLSPGLYWNELPGLPAPARRGINTNLAEVAQSEQPQPGLVALVEDLTGKAWEEVKAGKKAVSDTAKSANSALNVLIWGGVAIIAWNLFTATRPAAPRVD
ncbi:MAG: hypothetical protein ABW217_03000 [Polyangiaceae bacterium]